MKLSVMDVCWTVAQIACAGGFPAARLWSGVQFKVDGALSSLSAAVGGPVWLNGQSMKPLLSGLLILKMYLLIALQGILKASTKATEDAFFLHWNCRQFFFKICMFWPKIYLFFPVFLRGIYICDFS